GRSTRTTRCAPSGRGACRSAGSAPRRTSPAPCSSSARTRRPTCRDTSWSSTVGWCSRSSLRSPAPVPSTASGPMTTDPAADGAAPATARGPAVVLTGGPHPFAATTPQVVELLAEVGLAATVTPDPDRAAVLLAGAGSDDPDDRDDPGTRAAPRLLVLNTLRWRMGADRYASQREAHAYATSPAWRDAVTAHLAAGGALLALHAAPICFDDWPGWRDVVGAAWRWD